MFHNIPYANHGCGDRDCRNRSVLVSASPETRLTPLQKRRHALLVIVGQARERKLIDVHVAGEIVERVRQAVDGELGHRGRERRLAANLAASAMAASKAMPGSATSSLRRPCLD